MISGNVIIAFHSVIAAPAPASEDAQDDLRSKPGSFSSKQLLVKASP
ncbi:hypothetical protein [Paenibacillus nasutitermitis]|nr:hypothetical protein [Paenibacillus nasutitermitis]